MRRLSFILAIGLPVAFLITSIITYRYFGYVSAPGGDLYNHANHVLELQNEGFRVFLSGYPKLFHLIVLVGMKISGATILQTMLYLVPIVIIAAGLASFWLLKELKGIGAGILAMFLVMLVATQPLQTLYDGGFPSYIAVAVWTPLFLFCLAKLLEASTGSGRGVWFLGSIVMTILIILTHHFTAFYLGIFVVGLVLSRWKQVGRYGLILVGLLVALMMSPLSTGARSLWTSVLQVNGDFPWVHLIGSLNNPNAILPIASYPAYFPSVILWGGLLVVLYVFGRIVRRQPVELVVILLALWCVCLLVGSRIEALGFPIRLARDAGVPLALLSAYGLASLWQYLIARRAYYLAVSMLVVCILVLSTPVVNRLQRLFTFEKAMEYTPALDQAVKELKPGNNVVMAQILPTLIDPNLVSYFPPYDPLEKSFVSTAAIERLAPVNQVVVVVDRRGGSPDFVPLLEKAGFERTKLIMDPLFKAMLFTRK